MSKSDPAFPSDAVAETNEKAKAIGWHPQMFSGLSKRELGAFIIAAGMWANPNVAGECTKNEIDDLAIERADALLAKLEEKP